MWQQITKLEDLVGKAIQQGRWTEGGIVLLLTEEEYCVFNPTRGHDDELDGGVCLSDRDIDPYEKHGFDMIDTEEYNRHVAEANRHADERAAKIELAQLARLQAKYGVQVEIT